MLKMECERLLVAFNMVAACLRRSWAEATTYNVSHFQKHTFEMLFDDLITVGDLNFAYTFHIVDAFSISSDEL